MKKTESNLVEVLFGVQAHLGHKTNRVHPKSKKYIYSIENGVSIIDLTQTARLLQEAEEKAAELGTEGKVLLLVATKKIAAAVTQELAKKFGVSFITTKWPPGLLTNFESILKNISRLRALRDERDKGEWEQLVKHEQSAMKRELGRLERFYGGISDFKKTPDALFIVDLKKEKNALIEARKTKIPVIAICDTNIDPNVEFPIPANDDAAVSVEFITERILSSYAAKKQEAKEKEVEVKKD